MDDIDTPIDTVVIGAGHAGLAMSRLLQRGGIRHVVLERDTVASSWRQRWESFHLNTPNEVNVLPGGVLTAEPEGFSSRDSWISTLEKFHTEHDLPVHVGVEVRSIRPNGDGFEVQTPSTTLHARNVVLCTGDQNVPRVPELAAAVPETIDQMHSSRYVSPAKLAPGGVLVVGSGQSGVQIAEDLREAGRAVWLCTSKVGRAPRRYRGRDIGWWVRAAGLAEHRPEDVPEAERNARQGMISGTMGGHSVSLQSLGNAGVTVLGRLTGIDGHTARIGDDLLEHVAVGDQAVAKLREGLDKFIAAKGLDAPPPTPDPADAPCPRLEAMAKIRTLDLAQEGIGTVIWATGFGGNFSYLDPAFVDVDGRPKHTAGVCAPGLYCLGLTWLRRRISGLIPGAVTDASAIADQIQARAAAR